MAMTVAEGSKLAKYGVLRLRIPAALSCFKSQRRTVLSRLQLRKLSSCGERVSAVTRLVWPLK